MADYSTAAGQYWNAGFKGVLPVPAGRKDPVPSGYTGYKGVWPSWADIQLWVETRPDSNTALRLPNTIVGIDVDAYGDKKGNACLTYAENLYGELPPTVRSTSRLDGVSGIRLFRIPAGVELQTVITFPEMNLDGIEVCQYFHRYVMVWPSIHPTTERVYRWLDADGNILSDVPHLGSIPELPSGWIEALSRTKSQETSGESDAYEFIQSLTDGPMSFRVDQRLSADILKLENSTGGRHDIACAGILALYRLSEQGHSGARTALDILGNKFIEAVLSDGSRSFSSAMEEWDRMLYGQRGIDLIVENPTPPSLNDLLGKPAQPSETDEPDLFDLILMKEEGSNDSRTSWGPIDLDPILDGDLTPEEPTVLTRDDGKSIFYKGRINALVGESESGKSWVALIACVEQIEARQGVVFLDFEDTPHNVVGRLLALGASKSSLRSHFYYIGPDTPMGSVEKEELFGLLDSVHPGLIVLDGVNASMSLIGLELEKNKDCHDFTNWILKPLAQTGATLVTIDHVVKDSTTRGKYAIGAQAKRAMADLVIGVRTVEQFGRGRLGKLELSVFKDKLGGVRAHAEKRGDQGVDYLASAVIDAREEGKVVTRLVFEHKSGDALQDKIRLAETLNTIKTIDPDRNGVFITKIKKELGRDVREDINTLCEQGHLSTKESGSAYGNLVKLYIWNKPYDVNMSVNDMMGD